MRILRNKLLVVVFGLFAVAALSLTATPKLNDPFPPPPPRAMAI